MDTHPLLDSTLQGADTRPLLDSTLQGADTRPLLDSTLQGVDTQVIEDPFCLTVRIVEVQNEQIIDLFHMGSIVTVKCSSYSR